MKLAEIQQRFYALTSGEGEPSAELLRLVAESPGAPTGKRLRIYAENVRLKKVEGLAITYQQLARLLGRERFAELVAAYLRTFSEPRRTTETLTRGFPAFVAVDPGAWGRPDLFDLATLERARQEACDDGGGEPLGPEGLLVLEAGEWASVRLRFIAALRVLRLRFDVEALWRALDQELEPPPPLASPLAMLVWRQRLTVFHSVLTPEEAEALERARTGRPFGEVCEAFSTHDSPGDAAYAAVRSWFEDGLILSFSRAAS